MTHKPLTGSLRRWRLAVVTAKRVPSKGSPERAGSQAAGRVDVLMADRNREVVELVAHALDTAGLSFVAAHDEAAALAALLVQRPRVMVIDMVGLGALGRLRTASQ